MNKPLKVIALGSLLCGSFLLGTSVAQASACQYVAHNKAGKVISIEGNSKALKSSVACKRAYNKCYRKLKLAMKKGKVAKGAKCTRNTTKMKTVKAKKSKRS